MTLTFSLIHIFTALFNLGKLIENGGLLNEHCKLGEIFKCLVVGTDINFGDIYIFECILEFIIML